MTIATGTGIPIAGGGVAARAALPVMPPLLWIAETAAALATIAANTLNPVFQRRIVLLLFGRCRWFQMGRRGGLPVPPPLPQLLDNRVEYGDKQQGEQSGGEHAAEHRGADR